MSRTEELLETAADRARLAVEQGSQAWEEKVVPLLDTAARKVKPAAEDAWEAVKEAGRRSAGLAAGTVERLQPTVNTALSKVAPAIDRAQKSVEADLLPKLITALHHAAETPAGGEARAILARLDERADASAAALKAELARTDVATTAKPGKAKKIVTLAALGAILGALAVAVKTFLGSREDWAAYEPDEPYVYPDDDYEIDGVIVEDEAAPEAEPAPATAPYGEGSYAGPNPPAEFTIKGNERSMKYHVPGSAGYARTGGDVWFVSEAAAEAAGFVRSLR